MARFLASEADNYGGSGKSQFFALQEDKQTANVRFMYNGMEDIEGYAVHEITLDGKKRAVNCLRSYNDPKSVCPLCAANNFQRAKLYIPLYDTESGEVKIWERGKTFVDKLSSLCGRYATGSTPLVAHTFDVERCGKPRDTNTTYQVYETGCDDTRLADLPEIPQVLGTIILDKTADELQFYVDNGYFPNNDGAPTRHQPSAEEPTGRRTPSRRGEAF